MLTYRTSWMRAGLWGIVMMMIDDAVGGAMNRVGVVVNV
jgi:hypothetical protein